MSISEDQSDREARAAGNQSIFREINERIEDLNEGFSLVLPVGEWVCECASDTCTERVEMTAEQYEAIRKNGAHFFVAASDEHVWPDVERVVERNDHYWIVEKIGQAGEIAKDADPRADGRPRRLQT
jgi:hypothetical protein